MAAVASQVAEVVVDTSAFEVSQFYCEPVQDLQQSDSQHRGELATRLTRFVFFCNALEEAYRFCVGKYDTLRLDKNTHAGKGRALRSASLKSAAVLRDLANAIELPSDFRHLVQNLDGLARVYEQGLSVKLARAVNDPTDIAYGLDIVRALRNHVAHGTFPIVDNPEYSEAMTKDLRHAVFNLLHQAVRVGALYIQLLLAVDNDGLNSQLYGDLCDDPSTGGYFARQCTRAYLLSLHREQEFGLNEGSFFQWTKLAEDSA